MRKGTFPSLDKISLKNMTEPNYYEKGNLSFTWQNQSVNLFLPPDKTWRGMSGRSRTVFSRLSPSTSGPTESACLSPGWSFPSPGWSFPSPVRACQSTDLSLSTTWQDSIRAPESHLVEPVHLLSEPVSLQTMPVFNLTGLPKGACLSPDWACQSPVRARLQPDRTP
jgi:hypothetical protein